MRLINTKTLEFQIFFSDAPRYVILSHRWADAEASLQIFLEFVRQKKASDLKRSQRRKYWPVSPMSDVSALEPGLRKVATFCQIARKLGYGWAWIDTVCINRLDLAELSEAINSMFRWYQDSACCFVYLEDVLSVHFHRQFRQSEWFDRGWTLQEVIAPNCVTFFDSCWSELGTKQQLEGTLSAITGIPADVLRDPASIRFYNTAQRLSWASRRRTTREEDLTYSLLGLLNINMPLLYGEGGHNALKRMFKTLMEESADESLLAWELCDQDLQDVTEYSRIRLTGSDRDVHGVVTGLLARSLRQFEGCGDIQNDYDSMPSVPNRITNMGLEVNRLIRSTPSHLDEHRSLGEDTHPIESVRILELACRRRGADDLRSLVLVPEQTSNAPAKRWRRVMFSESEARKMNSFVRDQVSLRRNEHLFVRVLWPETLARSKDQQPQGERSSLANVLPSVSMQQCVVS